MKLDIGLPTSMEIQGIIIPMFKSVGWKQIDESCMEIDISRVEKLWMVIFPELLNYENSVELWYRCRVNGSSTYDIWGSCLKENIEKLPIKVFQDEDAYLGCFSSKEEQLSFFLNPSYPKGYWSNHAIQNV